MPRIRLISDIAPGSTHTAGIVLEQIIENVGLDYDWEINTIVDDGLPNYMVTTLVPKHSISWTRKPQEWHPPGLIMMKCFATFVEYLAAKDLEEFIKEIIRLESRNRSEIILIAIQGQSSYRIAKSLLDANLNVSLIFWDPWQWWESAKNVPLRFRKTINSVHELAIKKGIHLFPTKDFGLDLGFPSESITVLYPHVSKFVNNNLHKKQNQLNKSILFAGQGYAGNEIKTFYSFLQKPILIKLTSCEYKFRKLIAIFTRELTS
jgi:transcriptional regulator